MRGQSSARYAIAFEGMEMEVEDGRMVLAGERPAAPPLNPRLHRRFWGSGCRTLGRCSWVPNEAIDSDATSSDKKPTTAL